MVAIGTTLRPAAFDAVLYTGTITVTVLITGGTFHTAGVRTAIAFIAGTKSFVVFV